MEASTIDRFRENIFEMRDKGWLVDVTIACSGQLFYAHKLILSASSDYFKEMFSALPSQQYPIIFLKGISQEILKLALEFMYCGMVDIPEEKVQQFIAIADEFRIKGLNFNATEDNTTNEEPSNPTNVKEELDSITPLAKRRKISPRKRSNQNSRTQNVVREADINENEDEADIHDDHLENGDEDFNSLQSWELFTVNFIEHIGKFNSLSINQIRTIAAAAAEMSGEGDIDSFHNSSDWWHQLQAKFPQLNDFVKKEGLNESLARIPTTKEFLNPFIEILSKFKLNKNPEYIWSCEEIAISAKKGPKKETIAYPARIRGHSGNSSSKNNSMSILCSISPSGKNTSPFFVVRDDPATSEELNKGNIIYATNESGSVDKSVLMQWFNTVFLPQCPKKRCRTKPVVLLVDSQFFNITIELMEIALKENVLLFPLMPHIPVACQPFDLILFNKIRPDLETEFSETTEKKRLRRHSSSYEPIGKVKTVMDKHLTNEMAKEGFSKCGIFPYNIISFVQCNQARVGVDSTENNNQKS